MLKLLSFKISFHLKQSTLLAILILGVSSTKVVGQSRVYRTINDGSWHDITSGNPTWQYSTDNRNWTNVVDPVDLPNEDAAQIIIDNFISINFPVQADDIVINGGLTVESELTIPNAGSSGIQLNFGLLSLANGLLNLNNNAITGNGEVMFNSGNLGLGSPDGLDIARQVGNIQGTGELTFGQDVNFIYNGTTAQQTGSGLPVNAHIEINNPAGVTLSQPTKAASVTLTAGKLITESTKLLTLNNGGPVTAAPGSFVDGPLAIKANAPGVLRFPIGKGTNARPIELKIVSTTGENTYLAEQHESEFTNQSLVLPATVTHISKLRYFSVEKIGAESATANIKLSYGNNDGVTDSDKLTIVKFHDGQTEDLSVTQSGDGFVTSDVFSEFSFFMLANKTDGNNPLPVELITFTAKANENATVLTWETASEQNSNHFEIQRSQNAQTFETLGTIQAAGQSQSLKRYIFEDKNPMNGLTYYRLKQVDTDGAVAYSRIEQVNRKTGNLEMQLYPNPTTSKLYIATSNPISKVIILNTLGQEVVAVDQTENNTGATLDLTHLSAGVYQLVIESGSTRETRKFVKTGL